MTHVKSPATALPMPSLHSRRRFIGSGAGTLSAALMASQWSSIIQAAEHAGHVADDAAGTGESMPAAPALRVLSAAEAADVEAIANQIVPGGDTPGAREARVVFFIDRALDTFLAAQATAFRSGLAHFQKEFAAHDSAGKAFASVSEARQLDWLYEVEGSEFFQSMRQLTVLGLVASPQYGGNYQKGGWKLLGFDDRHVWQPPFGHYDADYPGFEPYPGTRPWSADPKVKA